VPNNIQLQSIGKVGSVYKCDICGKTFSFPSNLKRHMMSIHDKSKFQCNQCDKHFSFASNLRRHVLSIHETKKTACRTTYPCNHCSKEFLYAANVKRHVEYTHEIPNGESRSFHCDLCDKDFAFESNLKRHILSVHQLMRFICSECGKEFSYASNLRRHVMSCHNKNRYYCQICAKDFSYASNLRRHMISSHGNEHRVGVFGENGEIQIKDETIIEQEDEDVKELHMFTSQQQQLQQSQAVASICAPASHCPSPRESPAPPPCNTPNHIEITTIDQSQINMAKAQINPIFSQSAHGTLTPMSGITPMKHMGHNISIQTAPVQIVPINLPVSMSGLRAPMTTTVFRTPNGNIVSTL